MNTQNRSTQVSTFNCKTSQPLTRTDRRMNQQRTKNPIKKITGYKYLHKNCVNQVRKLGKCSEQANRGTKAFAIIEYETKHPKPETRTDRRTNNEQKIP